MKNCKGYTLVEVLVSIALVSILLIPAAEYFNEAIRIGRKSKQLVQASNIAQKYLEIAKDKAKDNAEDINLSDFNYINTDGVYQVVVSSQLIDFALDAAGEVFENEGDSIDFGDGDDITNASEQIEITVTQDGINEVMKISSGGLLKFDSSNRTSNDPNISLEITESTEIDCTVEFKPSGNIKFSFDSPESDQAININCYVTDANSFAPYTLEIINRTSNDVKVNQFNSTENLKIVTSNRSSGTIVLTKNLIDTQLSSDSRARKYLIHVAVSVDGKILEEIESMVRVKK